MQNRQKNTPEAEPLVSIIMPFKNAADFVGACVESLRNQSFTQWELLAVNDHSTDAGPAIVRSFSANDRRVKVFENPRPGIIAALQTGLKYSQGSFISRMDADDLMPADRLQKMTQALASANQKTVVTGLVKYFSEQTLTPGYKKYERWLNQVQLTQSHRENIYRECVVASPNWIMRKKRLACHGRFCQFGISGRLSPCF